MLGHVVGLLDCQADEAMLLSNKRLTGALLACSCMRPCLECHLCLVSHACPKKGKIANPMVLCYSLLIEESNRSRTQALVGPPAASGFQQAQASVCQHRPVNPGNPREYVVKQWFQRPRSHTFESFKSKSQIWLKALLDHPPKSPEAGKD